MRKFIVTEKCQIPFAEVVIEWGEEVIETEWETVFPGMTFSADEDYIDIDKGRSGTVRGWFSVEDISDCIKETE